MLPHCRSLASRFGGRTPYNIVSTALQKRHLIVIAPQRTVFAGRAMAVKRRQDAVVDAPEQATSTRSQRQRTASTKATALAEQKAAEASPRRRTTKAVEPSPAKVIKASKASPKKAAEAMVEEEGVDDAKTEEGVAKPTKGKKKETKPNEDAAAEANGASDEPLSLSAPVPRSKTDYEAAEGIPRNMTIPDPLTLEDTPKPTNSTRIASWNILSLKSAMGKGMLRYVEAEDADVLFFTETKCNDVPTIPALTSRYPHQTWGIGKTKGYAGVAMLSKVKPLKVITGLPGSSDDTKGRAITAEFDRYIVCGTYVVNAGEGLKTMDAKVRWNEAFALHLAECNARKPTIWTGDLNVVLDARDLSKASQKWNKSPGYTATECDHHRRILAGTAAPDAQPYVDIWRERNPDAIGHFTFYGFRGMCRSKGIGWRLDSFIVPERFKNEVINVGIRHTVYGPSDHLPVYMDIKGTL